MSSISNLILLLVNNFMQISVDIWALRNKVLCSDPNESSAVYLLTSDNKHAVCGTDFSQMQINFFAKNISNDSSLWKRFSIMCQARKMIKFHQRSFQNINVKQICADFVLQ